MSHRTRRSNDVASSQPLRRTNWCYNVQLQSDSPPTCSHAYARASEMQQDQRTCRGMQIRACIHTCQLFPREMSLHVHSPHKIYCPGCRPVTVVQSQFHIGIHGVVPEDLREVAAADQSRPRVPTQNHDVRSNIFREHAIDENTSGPLVSAPHPGNSCLDHHLFPS